MGKMILTLAEYSEGKVKKNTLECLTFARNMAEKAGDEVGVVMLGDEHVEQLSEYGADKVFRVPVSGDLASDNMGLAVVMSSLADQYQADTVVLSHNSTGRGLAGRLSVKLEAGLVSGVIHTAEGSTGEWVFEKSVFSGKATAKYEVRGRVVITLTPNSIPLVRSKVDTEVIDVDTDVKRSIRVISREETTGTVPLPEAELVVSAGRGMKDPANWGIVEDLADALGATLACSRPVADAHWRPHHEHVGQTGVAIRPNLYIAIGISGAIQHLAGVNNSKVIVVINKDPEAPFFKAADYGVCADLFDVVPRLTEAIRKYKS